MQQSRPVLPVLLALRFLKLLSVAMLFAGSAGVVMASDSAERRRFALWLAAPGLGLSWTLGFLLAAQLDASLLSAWIVGAMALSFLSLQGVLFAVAKEGRRGAGLGALILLPLVACLALMVFRPG